MKKILLAVAAASLLASNPVLAQDEYGLIGKADSFCAEFYAKKSDATATKAALTFVKRVPAKPDEFCAKLATFHKAYNAYEADPTIWQGKIPVSQDYLPDLSEFFAD